jgi:DNA-binding LacI/PurR family transcriptional regulator
MQSAPQRACKYRNVLGALRREIHSGTWKPGDRLPSEAELVGRFHVSRITVGRAVRELQQAGLVQRRAGAGTFVTRPPASGWSFGLLIPDFGTTEIFEPICHGMMGSPLARQHALVWGSASRGEQTAEDRTWALCRQYIERGVSGVFFAPLEGTAGKDESNLRIARAFDAAGIPVVLLDRPLLPSSTPGRQDVVGIDNWRAGLIMTEHLVGRGCERIGFVRRAHAAPTVDLREAGYREALHVAGVPFDPLLVLRSGALDSPTVQAFVDRHAPDGVVCSNDRLAAELMRVLLELGYRIPSDIRLVGIDDGDYSRLLPVPLTTLRQPTRQIGEVALSVMLERMERPDLPARHVLLQCELIVRESST